MTEDQVGVPLWLDVGVLDMATCEPLDNALVNFWHCNATGSYSSFTGISPDTPFPTLLSELNITDFEIGTTDLHTDDTTWLRGLWPTDSNGMMEMKTIFPGFVSASIPTERHPSSRVLTVAIVHRPRYPHSPAGVHRLDAARQRYSGLGQPGLHGAGVLR